LQPPDAGDAENASFSQLSSHDGVDDENATISTRKCGRMDLRKSVGKGWLPGTGKRLMRGFDEDPHFVANPAKRLPQGESLNVRVSKMGLHIVLIATFH
jgi:hypothetical protein